jgi:hypothetical protein
MSRSSTIFEKDIGVVGGAWINEIKELGGIRPQKIVRIHTCDVHNSTPFGTWGSSGNSTAGSQTADGPMNNSNTGKTMKITYGNVTDGYVYINSTTSANIFPLNLLGMKYIGFWYQANSGDDFAAGELKLELFSRGKTDSSDPNCYFTVDFTVIPDEQTWRYMLLDISSAPDEVLKNITELRITEDHAATALNTYVLNIYMMEAFTYAYKEATYCASGPARGLIMKKVVEPGADAILDGTTLMYSDCGNVQPMRVQAATDLTGRLFAGVSIEAADASATYDSTVECAFVVDGVIHRHVTTGSVQAFESVTVDAAVLNDVVVVSASERMAAIGIATCPLHGSAAGDVIPILLGKDGYGYENTP